MLLREDVVDQALAHTKDLGLHYWESYVAHVPLTTDPAQVATFLAKLKAKMMNTSELMTTSDHSP